MAKNQTKMLHIVVGSHSMNIWTHSKKKKKKIANGILAKIRYYVSANILETIFNAFIATHMRYACQICSQSHSKTSNMTQNV